MKKSAYAQKLRSGVSEPPIGGFRGSVRTSSMLVGKRVIDFL